MKKFGKIMVLNIDVLSSNLVMLVFFVLNWKLGKMLCQPKHVSFMLVFHIGPLQKILIIIACGCWIQTYRQPLVQSI